LLTAPLSSLIFIAVRHLSRRDGHGLMRIHGRPIDPDRGGVATPELPNRSKRLRANYSLVLRLVKN